MSVLERLKRFLSLKDSCKRRKVDEQDLHEVEIQANRAMVHQAAEDALAATEKLNELLEQEQDTAYIIYLATRGEDKKNERH